MKTKACSPPCALARLSFAVLATGIFPGHAQEAYPDGGVQPAVQGRAAGAVKTGKERLGDKASDGQRLDDCKVPLIRRGPEIRPDECSSNP
ncbi:MAG: hypothetical protein L0Y57_03060 [Beijerinckiaceae bacterium]|nr:hypothetical protein [Beijerinckiaceae bacterium]